MLRIMEIKDIVLRDDDPQAGSILLTVTVADDLRLRLTSNPAGTAEFNTKWVALKALKASMYSRVSRRIGGY
jgi:hypothetical protein